jgi:hypothetical protein
LVIQHLQLFGHFANLDIGQVILILVAFDLQVLVVLDVLPSAEDLLPDAFVRVLGVAVNIVEYLCQSLNFLAVILLVGDRWALLDVALAGHIRPTLHQL